MLRGVIATENFFEVLGVRAAMGRTFTASDTAVVVISHGLWESRLGRDPAIVGERVILNGRPYEVIGVLPGGFRGPDVLESYDLYVPMAMQPQVRPPRAGFSGEMDPDLLNRRTASWLRVIGRLRSGVSFVGAGAAVSTIARRLQEAFPATDGERTATIFPVSKLDPRAWPILRSIALLLMGVGCLVLVVATSNVASLLLARTLARRREMAVRQAIGGGRGRLIRQLLTESLVLALLGGALGLLVATWSLQGFSRLVPAFGMFSFTLDFATDERVLLFTLGLSVVSAMLVGIAPALQGSRSDLARAINDPSAEIGSRRSRLGARNVLVLAQLALSVVLMVGAGLFLQSFERSRATAPGFAVDEILTARLRVDLLRYTKTQGQIFYRELLERMAARPRVRSASLARVLPLAGGGRTTVLRLDNRDAGGEPEIVDTNVVGLDFFRTMGIPLLAGRDFSQNDVEGALGVAIVNESFVARYFPSGESLGGRIQLGGEKSPWLEIVGIAADSKYRSLGEGATPYVYQPLGQQHETGMTLLLRTSGEPAMAAADVRRTLLAIEPNLPVSDIQPFATVVGSSLFPARMGARLLSAFAVLAVSLAAFGLYGVVSFALSQRTRELGIRVAVGARPSALVGLVVKEGMVLVGIGLGFGWIGAALAGRLLTRFLYEVNPLNPIAFGAASFMLFTVMLLSTYLPARKAARTDPLTALRYE